MIQTNIQLGTRKDFEDMQKQKKLIDIVQQLDKDRTWLRPRARLSDLFQPVVLLLGILLPNIRLKHLSEA